jgi:hypothetical protein
MEMHIHIWASVVSPNGAEFTAGLHAGNTGLDSSSVADFPVCDIFAYSDHDTSAFAAQAIFITNNHSLADPTMLPALYQDISDLQPRHAKESPTHQK